MNTFLNSHFYDKRSPYSIRTLVYLRAYLTQQCQTGNQLLFRYYLCKLCYIITLHFVIDQIT